MRVLLFTDCYDINRGGAEKVFFKMIEDFNKSSDVKVFSSGFGQPQDSESIKVFKDTKSKFLRFLGRICFRPFLYINLRKYFKSINPDIIHFHNINKNTLTLLLAAKAYKSIMTVHDFGIVCPTKWNIHSNFSVCETGFRFKCFFKHKRNINLLKYIGYVFNFYMNKFLFRKYINSFVTPSPQLKEYMSMYGYKNTLFIPNSFNLSMSNLIKNEKDKNMSLYIGQLEENKGVSFLIDVFNEVVKQNKDAKLYIGGTGSLETDLQEKIDLLKLSKNVKLLGWVNPNEYLPRSQFLIVPSIWMENAPISIQEAMKYSLPVIGTNRGGIPWLVKDNISGLIVDEIDVKQFSEKILYLYENPERVKKMGIAAFDRLSDINNLNINNKAYKDLYFQIIRGNK